MTPKKPSFTQNILNKLRGWRSRESQIQQKANELLDPDLLWWLFPQKLLGMAKPEESELPYLSEIGIKAIVSLLTGPSLAPWYKSQGFRSLTLPIEDGGTPTTEQVKQFVRFVDECQQRKEAVAVHCRAGWGRTGTMLAGYLIVHGSPAQKAFRLVRQAQPHAIKTTEQEEFLTDLADKVALTTSEKQEKKVEET